MERRRKGEEGEPLGVALRPGDEVGTSWGLGSGVTLGWLRPGSEWVGRREPGGPGPAPGLPQREDGWGPGSG